MFLFQSYIYQVNQFKVYIKKYSKKMRFPRRFYILEK